MEKAKQRMSRTFGNLCKTMECGAVSINVRRRLQIHLNSIWHRKQPTTEAVQEEESRACRAAGPAAVNAFSLSLYFGHSQISDSPLLDKKEKRYIMNSYAFQIVRVFFKISFMYRFKLLTLFN